MKKKWIQKRLISFRLNGKERYLAWNKNVYREWFRFAQISDLTYPPEFGDLSQFDYRHAYIDIHERIGSGLGRYNKGEDKVFEKWWTNHRELFIEPIDTEKSVVILDSQEQISIPKDRIAVSIDLQDTDKAIHELILLMEKLRREYEFKSGAIFQPSLPQKAIQLRKLMTYRIAWDLKIRSGLSRKEIAIHLIENNLLPRPDNFDSQKSAYLSRKDGSSLEEEAKRVSFYWSRARQIFKNIERGTFP